MTSVKTFSTLTPIPAQAGNQDGGIKRYCDRR